MDVNSKYQLTPLDKSQTVQESTLPKNQEPQQNTPKNKKVPKVVIYLMASIILLAVAFFGFYIFRDKITKQTPTSTSLSDATPQATNYPTRDTQKPNDFEQKTYTNETFKITLMYPNNWFGPEVNEYGNGFYFEVGTDTVYPYGTDRSDQIFTKENSYYITFQYTKRPENISVEQYKEDQPWINMYLPLMSMQDGESFSNARSLLIRVKEVDIGDFSGVEFISTLSETAQTEMYYGREVFLINDNYDTIRITGAPNNITVADNQNWKEDYEKVDEENLQQFRSFVNSISL